MKTLTAGALAVTLLCLAVNAENIVFPSNSGVVDITKAPYYADNTGQTDVSAILTQALNDERASGSWLSKIVYLPNGTYLVRNTVRQKEPPFTVGPHLQGQSREGTVIRLEDGTWPTVTGLQFVLSTGNGVAQCFNRGVRNLTVNIGSNNAGASGIWWFGNNGALLSDVDVISEDGQGVIGLHAGTGESGPSGVRNLYVRGFRIGVQTEAINAVTFFNIKVENQSFLGILARSNGCPAWFDLVESVNRVTAFKAESAARVVLVDATFSGGADSCEAIWNYSGARLFARNVTASGYRGVMYCPSTIQTLDKIPQGMYIDEFSSHKDTSQFASSDRTLNLPRKMPPEPEWEQDMNKWAVVSDYSSGRTDAEAFQAAIDAAGKTVVDVDYSLRLNTTVYVRNDIKLVVGTNCGLYNDGGGRIEIVDGTAPVVMLMNLSHNDPDTRIAHRTSRTVILESITSSVEADGSGDLFMTDCLKDLHVNNSDINVWAWHFNAEDFGIELTAGTIRCFGWKTEHDGNKVLTTGGTLEMLGFEMYAPCGTKSNPLLDITDTEFSMAMMNQLTFCDGALYEHLITETRDGTTRDIYATGNSMGYDLPLYLSHNRAVQDAAPRPEVIPRRAAVPATVVVRRGGGQAVLTVQAKPGSVVRVIDTRGRTTATCRSFGDHVNASVLLPHDLPEGVYHLRQLGRGGGVGT